MDDAGRHLPPSPGRLAAAERAGLLRGSPLVGAGLVVLAGAGAIWLAGARLAALGVGVVQGGLAAATGLASPAAAVREQLSTGLTALLPILAAVLAVSLLLALWRVVGRSHRVGQSEVPLPPAPRPSVAVLTVRLAGLLLFGLAALHTWRDLAVAVPASLAGDPATLGWIGELVVRLTAVAGGALIAAGLAESAIARRVAWRALHLTAAEARREQRVSAGDPRVRGLVRRRARSAGEEAR